MKKYHKKVSVMGLGYIGLPSAALLASTGYEVLGVDIDLGIVEIINSGKSHIFEPGLERLVKNSVVSGNLKAFSVPQRADIYIICVPTPFHSKEGFPKPDLKFVLRAIESIVKIVKEDDIVILESTSPIGTTQLIRQMLSKAAIDIEKVSVAYCPERVLPGNIISELVKNDRVIGGVDSRSTDFAASFYETFIDGKVIRSTAKAAEICKLAENSFRDVNIAFANELSKICDHHNINTWDLIKLANHHPRVNILQPGIGVGGHCVAVDPWFLVSSDPENAQLIRLAREVNDLKPTWVINKIMTRVEFLVSKGFQKPKVACLGLAFKPDIDDLRESPAVKVVDELVKLGVDVMVVEPNISNHDDFNLYSFQDAFEADLLVLLVKHKEFLGDVEKDKLLKAKALDFCGALV